MTTRKEIFGKNLKRIRTERGISRKELAVLIGMDGNTFSPYERGLREPPLDKIFKLADILKVSVAELLGDNEYNNNLFAYRMRFVSEVFALAGIAIDKEKDGLLLTLPKGGSIKAVIDLSYKVHLFNGKEKIDVADVRSVLNLRDDTLTFESETQFLIFAEHIIQKAAKENVGVLSFLENLIAENNKKRIAEFAGGDSDEEKKTENIS